MDIRPALTVSALNEQVRVALAPLREVRVEGEVSGAKLSGGHQYFDLKDATSKVRVTIWRQALQRITLQIRDGMKVVCTGRIDVWVQGGTYALNASAVEAAGIGALWEALQRLKDKLTAEGLFATNHKKKLPFLPRTVGLVTSPTGAALRDMLRILGDRCPVRVLIAPAKVQGEGAAESIAQAIERLDACCLCDVIIVGRGGGSLEDLWAFNEERVVRAVAVCRTPIVSAVGHETDTLLSDHAADVRAPTPTAAAELVVPRIDDLRLRLKTLGHRMGHVLGRVLITERRLIIGLRARLGEGGELTGPRALRLDDAQRRLQHAAARSFGVSRRRTVALAQRLQAAHPQLRLAQQQRRLDGLRMRLQRQGQPLLERRRQELAHKTAVLQAMSPRAALGRGYGIVRRPDGAALASVDGVRPGARIEVLLADGSLDCLVEAVRGA